jgi:mannose-1-phosphate guanylyltransferase/mannose-6-phosphate isomerase
MVPLDAGWNDLGAWDAVWQVAPRMRRATPAWATPSWRTAATPWCTPASRLVAVVGLDDVVVVETARRRAGGRPRAQPGRQEAIVNRWARRPRRAALHRKVHRPWGWYDSIDAGPRFQVKRIMVKPGASLSLQMHHHRAEHWIVVSGTAEVTNGDKTLC